MRNYEFLYFNVCGYKICATADLFEIVVNHIGKHEGVCLRYLTAKTQAHRTEVRNKAVRKRSDFRVMKSAVGFTEQRLVWS